MAAADRRLAKARTPGGFDAADLLDALIRGDE
jgi:hypothetical protein